MLNAIGTHSKCNHNGHKDFDRYKHCEYCCSEFNDDYFIVCNDAFRFKNNISSPDWKEFWKGSKKSVDAIDMNASSRLKKTT